MQGFGKPKSRTKFSIKNQVPSKVPPIYDGNRLIVYKMIDKNLEINEEITIKVKTAEGILENTFKITDDSFIEGRNLHQLFARKLLQEIEERQETEYNEDAKELITELGMRYNLAAKYTSFVGVNDKIVFSDQNSFAIGMKTRKVANQHPISTFTGFAASSSAISQMIGRGTPWGPMSGGPMGPMFGDPLSGQFGASVATESTMFGCAPAQACEAQDQLQSATGSMFSGVTGRSSRGSVSLGQHKLSSLIMGEEDGKAE